MKEINQKKKIQNENNKLNDEKNHSVKKLHSKVNKNIKVHNSNRSFEDISVVIPLYNEAGSLVELSDKLDSVLTQMYIDKWEVIFIDDGSTDNSIEILKQLATKKKNFKYISFRRNYGKSAALAVGFEYSRGNLVATMDADLQDDPNELPNMLQKLNEGFDLVSGWKQNRKDPISKTIPSKFFNYVTSKASGIKLHDFNCGLKLYNKDVVKTIHVYGEMHRYIPALAFMEGFKVTEIPVKHYARKYGKSKYGFSRFINGFLDLLTVFFTSKYLKQPLHFFGLWGTVFVLLGLVLNIYLSWQWIAGNTYLSNRPIIFLGMLLIIVGVQLFSMGLLGEMLTKNNIQSKNTLNYSIKDKSFGKNI